MSQRMYVTSWQKCRNVAKKRFVSKRVKEHWASQQSVSELMIVSNILKKHFQYRCKCVRKCIKTCEKVWKKVENYVSLKRNNVYCAQVCQNMPESQKNTFADTIFDTPMCLLGIAALPMQFGGNADAMGMLRQCNGIGTIVTWQRHGIAFAMATPWYNAMAVLSILL